MNKITMNKHIWGTLINIEFQSDNQMLVSHTIKHLVSLKHINNNINFCKILKKNWKFAGFDFYTVLSNALFKESCVSSFK